MGGIFGRRVENFTVQMKSFKSVWEVSMRRKQAGDFGLWTENFTMKERDFTIFRRKRTLLEGYLPVHHFGFW